MSRVFILLVCSMFCNVLEAQTLRSTLLLKNLTALSNQDSLNLRPLADKLKGSSNYSIKLSYYSINAKENFNGYKGHAAELQALKLIKAFFIAMGYDPQKIIIVKAKKSDYMAAKKAGILLSGGVRVDIAIKGYKEPPINNK